MRCPPRVLAAFSAAVACSGAGDLPAKDSDVPHTDTDPIDTTTPVTVHIEPAAPRFDEDLRCVIDSAPHGVAVTIRWTVDGGAYAGPASQDVHPTDHVDDLNQAGLQVWTCTATVGAGTSAKSGTSAAVTIQPPVPMVRIEPGSIRFATLYDHEYRTYRLTRAFGFSATEVTQEAYRKALEEPPMPLTGTRMPVQRLTFHQAARFENALSAADGLPACYPCTTVGRTTTCVRPTDLYSCTGYRLPSETEWAFVASERGAHPEDMLPSGGNFAAPQCGSTNSCYDEFGYYPDVLATGSNAPHGTTVGDQCIYVANAATATGSYGPNPVGTKLPTEQGVYDLCGNVNEWVADGYPPTTSQGLIDPYVHEAYSGLANVSDFQALDGSLDVKTRFQADDNANTAGIRVTRTLTTAAP
jgi:formylglycine-generating enzyme required for sulfatase activity